MKKIGVIGAMEEEVALLIGQMKNRQTKTMAGMEFHSGKLWEKDAVVVKSGIGKVNMGICTQILVSCYGVDAVINTGIAGGLYKDLKVGDVVISSDVVQHDMDCTGFGYQLGEIPRMGTTFFEADKELIQLAKESCEIVNPEIQCLVGRVATGDQFISNNEKKQWIIDNFDAYCAEMEGGAMAQTAYLNQVPFVVIRAISDNADNSATITYEEFEQQAIIHTMKLLTAMFLKMN